MNFDELGIRLKELYDKIINQDYFVNESYDIVKVEFNELFLNLIRESKTENKYFSCSPLEVYILHLNEEKKIDEKESVDFDETQFYQNEFLHQNKIRYVSNTSFQKYPYYLIFLDKNNYDLFRSVLTKRIEYLEKLLFRKGIEIITNRPYPNNERINFEFIKHMKIMVDNDNLEPLKPSLENTLKWNGTQTEFIELVKALIENGNVKGTQTEIISKLSNVFNIKINNENKLINDIKTRNNGSETLFLDRLQKSLFDYITLEKKK